MRLHYGRRVGKRSHVGVSVDPAKEGKGCLYLLFVWPLQLLYYVVVYPFVWLAQKLRKKQTKNGKRRQGSIKNWRWPQWAIAGVAGLVVGGIIVGGGDEELAREMPAPTPESLMAIAQEALTTTPTIKPAPSPTLGPIPVPTPEPTPEPGERGYVDADELNLRAEPSRDSDIIGEYIGGQVLEILGETGEWYEVKIDGKTGYMVQEYIAKGEYRAPAREPERETAQDERTVYWAESGDKYHSRKGCWTLQNSDVIYEGTIDEAVSFGRTGPCGVCY